MRDWVKWTPAEREFYRHAHRDTIGEPCTLDGQPAIVVFNMDTGWPSVRRLGDLVSVEYSFAVIDNILENRGGRFRS